MTNINKAIRELRKLGKDLTYAEKGQLAANTGNSLSTVIAYIDGDAKKAKTTNELIQAIKEGKHIIQSKVFSA